MDKDRIINALRHANAAVSRGNLIDALEFTRYALTELEDAKIAVHKDSIKAYTERVKTSANLDVKI